MHCRILISLTVNGLGAYKGFAGVFAGTLGETRMVLYSNISSHTYSMGAHRVIYIRSTSVANPPFLYLWFTTVPGLVCFSAVVGYILGLGCLDFLGVRFFMSWSIFLVRLLCSVCFMLSMFLSKISRALLAVRVSCCLNSVVNALISLSRVLHLSKWCSFNVFKNFSSACFVICFHLLCSFVVGPFAWGLVLILRPLGVRFLLRQVLMNNKCELCFVWDER